MPDAIAKWPASPSSNVNKYTLTFTLNDVAQTPVDVPRTAAQDSSGYTLDFQTALPGVTIQGGDKVGGSVVAVDTADNLTSSAMTATPIVEPVTPPVPPASLTIVPA